MDEATVEDAIQSSQSIGSVEIAPRRFAEIRPQAFHENCTATTEHCRS
jgi:hypothetical protein